MGRSGLHPPRRGRARWTSTQSRSERWMACAARCGPATCSRPAQPQAQWRADASELDAEAKDDGWIAIIGIQQIGAEVELLVGDADHGTDFDVRILSANPSALRRDPCAEPVERRIRQVRAGVEEIIG